jgi:mono/diheme cytochrome c family protein
MLRGLPTWVIPTLAIMTTLALIPIVLIAKARTTNSPKPRVELIPDMDNQPKYKAQSANAMFADGRGMRPVIPGTVARGELQEDEHFYRGLVDDEWAERFPIPVTEELMARGKNRYDIYCVVCHGASGQGDGIINKRALELQMSTWVPPSSFHTDLVRGRPVGHLFNTITNGIRNMSGYGSQLEPEDRWAVVAYVRALQRARRATIDDVPAERREALEETR